MPSSLLQRIDKRLKDMDLTDEAASKRAGLHRDTIRDLRRGKRTNLTTKSITALAKALGVTVEQIIGEAEPNDDAPAESKPLPGVRYAGIVEAGAFRAVDLFNQEGERRRVRMSAIAGFAPETQMAFRVEGDSMDLSRIFPGMWVQAVELQTWRRLHGEPGDGSIVVVENQRDGELELTVKKLRLFRDRMELQPDSSNPRHKAFVFPLPLKEEPQETRIRGVVLAAVWLYGDPWIADD